MRAGAGILCILLTLCVEPLAQQRINTNVSFVLLKNLVSRIPPRPDSAITGTEFARLSLKMKGAERERAIMAQLLQGNIPGFLRKLKPVEIIRHLEDAKTISVTIFVMPDYLAIGSDQDYLTIPMDLYSAVEIASQYRCILPTRKIVDAIFEQSVFQLSPRPLAPGPDMRSTAYYLRHALAIRRQRQELGCPTDVLVSGDKKDVVLTNRLAQIHGKIAIYGWHRSPGDPIQPLSTIHGATYADYSHGIRLVSSTVLMDGRLRSIYQILEDPGLADLLSDEGTMPQIRKLMTLRRDARAGAETPTDFHQSSSPR